MQLGKGVPQLTLRNTTQMPQLLKELTRTANYVHHTVKNLFTLLKSN